MTEVIVLISKLNMASGFVKFSSSGHWLPSHVTVYRIDFTQYFCSNSLYDTNSEIHCEKQ